MSEEDLARHYRVDENRMLDTVLGFPDQAEDAWEKAGGVKTPKRGKSAPLIVCGMGGSAIGGRLLQDFMYQDSAAPLHIETGYTLPGFAGRETPVICISYSGNTEEVLSCFQNALLNRCPVVVVTSGGELAEEADRAGTEILRIPDGMPPRAALGYLFIPLLRFVSDWDVYTVTDEEVETAVRRTRRLTEHYSLEGDPAGNKPLQLAKKLYGKIPLIYSGNGLLASAAYRWKCQFNENSKCMAFHNSFPELGHNEVMGWDSPERLREDLFLIMMRDSGDYPRVQKRMDVTYRMIEPLAGGSVVIDSEGERGREGNLARLLSILILGDLTSVYLAVEYGKDPTPIDKIDIIKEELRSEVK